MSSILSKGVKMKKLKKDKMRTVRISKIYLELIEKKHKTKLQGYLDKKLLQDFKEILDKKFGKEK